MLRVKTYLGPSPIHGLGVFAAEPISKGAVVWEYDEPLDGHVFAKNFSGLPELTQEFLLTYAWKIRDRWYFCSDNFRFVNHSSDPPSEDRPRILIGLQSP